VVHGGQSALARSTLPASAGEPYAAAMAKKFAWWKLLGLAGVLGGVATGAAITRQERERRSYSADEIRARLHRRHSEIEDSS